MLSRLTLHFRLRNVARALSIEERLSGAETTRSFVRWERWVSFPKVKPPVLSVLEAQTTLVGRMFSREVTPTAVVLTLVPVVEFVRRREPVPLT